MLESLEKMLGKGVDNSLLRFGLGKGYLDLGDNLKAAEHLQRCVGLTPSIRRPGSCWARRSWRRGIVRQRGRHGSRGLQRLRPMATSRPRKK